MFPNRQATLKNWADLHSAVEHLSILFDACNARAVRQRTEASRVHL